MTKERKEKRDLRDNLNEKIIEKLHEKPKQRQGREEKRDLGVKLSNKLSKDDGVHVVSQQMKQAPVSLGIIEKLRFASCCLFS